MKYTLTFVVSALLLSSACGLPSVRLRQGSYRHTESYKGSYRHTESYRGSYKMVNLESSRHVSEWAAPEGKVSCKLCVQFSVQAINQLLNIILQTGIVGGCGLICADLAAVTAQAWLGVVCDLVCDYVGVTEFVKFIESADLDPIYFCELVDLCGVNDNGDAKFTSLQVIPDSAPQGDKSVNFEYKSVNGTSTGEFGIFITTVDKLPLSDTFLIEQSSAGIYDGKIKVNAVPDPECDPTTGPCEKWLPGVYTVKLMICAGECGSKHPHSKIYDEATATFNITA